MKFVNVTNHIVTVEATLEEKRNILEYLKISLKREVLYATTEASVLIEDIENLLIEEIPHQLNNTNLLRLHQGDFVNLSSLTKSFIFYNINVSKYGIDPAVAKQIAEDVEKISIKVFGELKK